MPKRKRSGPASLQDTLDKHQDDISRALKAAKGFERQRLSKRLRDDGITADKKERLEREITVLKSLDLHQTARAHMHSSLLKVKSIATSTDLPDELRRGLSKPDLSEEEKTALHNVTSGLYNRDQVKQAVTRAVASVCDALNVPVPGKAKRVRKEKKEEEEEQPEDRMDVDTPVKKEAASENEAEAEAEAEVDDEEEWNGFESDVDEPGASIGEPDSEAEEVEEKVFSKYDHLLGSSSEEDSEADSGEEEDEDRFERFKGREKINLDDISLSGSAPSDEEEGSDEESEAEANPRPLSLSLSPSPPPAKKKKTTSKPTRPGDSTFLPTLMGGYISGSESEASDIDVAPAKKRRGQRQRQAIWEKKFGAKAKHLSQPATKREAGWDSKRGAVDGEDGSRTPWKKGIRNPLVGKGVKGEVIEERKPKVREPGKKDDEGPLHPSWEAMKKVKESQKTAAFAGSKIVFD
ncbi:Fc.00g038620.m01.CDS01 [Cosmosporella sp. VM-42]